MLNKLNSKEGRKELLLHSALSLPLTTVNAASPSQPPHPSPHTPPDCVSNFQGYSPHTLLLFGLFSLHLLSPQAQAQSGDPVAPPTTPFPTPGTPWVVPVATAIYSTAATVCPLLASASPSFSAARFVAPVSSSAASTTFAGVSQAPLSSLLPPTSAPLTMASQLIPVATAIPQITTLSFQLRPSTNWKAGNMPVQYRRIKCRREGGIRLTVDGSGMFVSVLIRNVGGSGDVVAVKVKRSRIGWLPMGRNWGQNWHINADLKIKLLSNGLTVTSYNVAPKEWNFGQSFEANQIQSS